MWASARAALALPRDRMTPVWSLSGAFVQGGVKKLSIDDLQRAMSDRVWGAVMGPTDDSFVISGATRVADFDREMQVLAAFVTVAAWRKEAFDQVQVGDAAVHDQADASPAGVLVREFTGLVHSGDARFPLADLGRDQGRHAGRRQGACRARACVRSA